jgi:hypothetical protein
MSDNEEMPAEVDFLKGVRGKYANAYAEGTNLVLLDPEVAAAFPDAESVNAALRIVLSAAQKSRNAQRK